MIIRIIDFLRADLSLVIKFCCALLGLLVALDAFCVDKGQAHLWFEQLPGFWSVFGFLACVGIILFSKWFGHLGIMTREDYYDR